MLVLKKPIHKILPHKCYRIYRKIQKKNKPCNQSNERLEGSRTTGASRNIGQRRGLLKVEPNALSNFPQQQDHGHLPRTEPRPHLAVRNRQEGLEGVSALGSADDPKLAGK